MLSNGRYSGQLSLFGVLEWGAISHPTAPLAAVEANGPLGGNRTIGLCSPGVGYAPGADFAAADFDNA